MPVPAGPCSQLGEDECVARDDCYPVYGPPDRCDDPNAPDESGRCGGPPPFLGCRDRPNHCPPVCAIYCEFGYVLDDRGCPTCQCMPPPNPCAGLSERQCIADPGCRPLYVSPGDTDPNDPGTGNSGRPDENRPDNDCDRASDGSCVEPPPCDSATDPNCPPPPCDSTTDPNCPPPPPHYAGCVPVPADRCENLNERQCIQNPGCEPQYVQDGPGGTDPNQPCTDAAGDPCNDTEPPCTDSAGNNCNEPPPCTDAAGNDCRPCECASGDPNCAPSDCCDCPPRRHYVGCRPVNECPMDFICADGSLPQGPDCVCPGECPLPFMCADGSHPRGPECWCPPVCDPSTGQNCDCPLDFVCPDGTLPQGPECICTPACDPNTGERCDCPLDFVCPDGSLPQGPECYCPPVCDPATGQNCDCPLDFICEDGSLPQGPDCRCPPVCEPGQVCDCSNVTCPAGTVLVGPNCQCEPDACMREFLCPDGSTPVGRDCICPSVCDPASTTNVCPDGTPRNSDCSCSCVYNGQVIPPGTSFPDTDGCNTCVCTDDGFIACTERACPQGCMVDGVMIPPGTTFTAADGCNTCVCDANGNAACTEMACNG